MSNLIRRFKPVFILLAAFYFSSVFLACKTTPNQPTTTEMITIDSNPGGADIYVEEKYAGKSPVSIEAPKNLRGRESIKIEARLAGYENKVILLGDYYPPHNRFMIGAGGGRGGLSIFGQTSIGRTTDGYYKFPELVNIELESKKP